jgi:hypothetical protein
MVMFVDVGYRFLSWSGAELAATSVIIIIIIIIIIGGEGVVRGGWAGWVVV